MILEVGYVGSHGNKLSKRWNLNQARLDTDPLHPTPVSSRVPFPRFGTVLGSFKAGISNYNALQVRLERSFQHGFYFVSGYTYSRCQDMDSSASFAADNQNIYDLKGDYGLCGFQIKNRFNVSGGWELPIGNNLKGVPAAFVKGWQLNSIVQLQDGSPFTPRVSGDPARVGRRYYARPDRTCDGNLPGDQQTVRSRFAGGRPIDDGVANAHPLASPAIGGRRHADLIRGPLVETGAGAVSGFVECVGHVLSLLKVRSRGSFDCFPRPLDDRLSLLLTLYSSILCHQENVNKMSK